MHSLVPGGDNRGGRFGTERVPRGPCLPAGRKGRNTNESSFPEVSPWLARLDTVGRELHFFPCIIVQIYYKNDGVVVT